MTAEAQKCYNSTTTSQRKRHPQQQLKPVEHTGFCKPWLGGERITVLFYNSEGG